MGRLTSAAVILVAHTHRRALITRSSLASDLHQHATQVAEPGLGDRGGRESKRLPFGTWDKQEGDTAACARNLRRALDLETRHDDASGVLNPGAAARVTSARRRALLHARHRALSSASVRIVSRSIIRSRPMMTFDFSPFVCGCSLPQQCRLKPVRWASEFHPRAA